MNNLNEVADQINKNIADKVPLLKGTPIDLDASANLVREIIDAQLFEVSNPQVDVNDTAITIHGAARFISFQAIPIRVGYRLIEGSSYFSVAATLPNLPGFAAFKLPDEPITLLWDYGPLNKGAGEADAAVPISLVRFRASLPFGKAQIPVVIRPPTDTGLWRLEGEFSEPLKLAGLQPVLQWLKGAETERIIPPALSRLTTLGITALQTVFDPRGKTIESASIVLQIGQAIPLIPSNRNFKLSNGILQTGFTRGPDGKVNLSATAYGDLQLGSSFIGVRVGFDAARKLTLLELAGGHFVLPSFGEIAAIIGGNKLLQQIPPVFRDLKSVLLKKLVFEIGASSRFDAHIALGCPGPVTISKGVSLENVDVQLDVESGQSNLLTASFNGLLQVGAEHVPVRGALSKTVTFSGFILELPVGELAGTLIRRLPAGLQKISLTNVAVSLDETGINFNCTSEMNIGELANRLGMELPRGLPADIKLSTVHVCVGFGEQAAASFDFSAELKTPAAFPDRSPHSLEIHAVRVGWSSAAGISGDVQLSGKLDPGEGLSFTLPGISLSYADKTWQGEADVETHIYGQPTAGFVANLKNNDTFMIEIKAGRTFPPLLDATDIVTCTVQSLSASLQCTAPRKNGAAGKWEFHVTGTGDIAIGPQSSWGFATSFEIKIDNEALLLEATNPSPITIPVGPQGHAELSFVFSKLGVEFSKTWSVSGSGTGCLKNIPDVAKDCFPSEFPEFTLTAGINGVLVACEFDKSKLAPAVNLFRVGGKSTPPRLQVQEIQVDLDKVPSIGAIIRIDRLKPLNYIFGSKDNGEPNVDFLSDGFDIRLTLAKQPLLALQLENGSPFKKLNLKRDPDGGDPYFVWDFGRNLNRFKVTMPTLQWGGGSWAGSGGLEIMDGKPFFIPLRPLKFILRGLKLLPQTVVDAIPPSVPIDVFDLKSSFRTMLEAVTSKAKIDWLYESEAGPILNEFERKVWAPLLKILDKMPKAFQRYTVPPDLQKIKFNITATPGSGWSGGLSLSARDGGAVRFMLPFFGGTLPELLGFSLKSLELGQAMAGLATFKIDGAIDRFDLVTLIVAATGVLEQNEVDNLRSHLELKRVSGAAFSASPVPVPLLYDQICWDYKNWWGLEAKSNWTLQLAEGVDIWTLLRVLLPFFTKKLFHIADPQNRAEDDLRLRLTAGPNYLKLPDYLGVKKPLGFVRKSPTLPADVSVRWLLDACKFVNPGYAIRSIPLQTPDKKSFVRMGYEKIVCGPLEIDAGWCITTAEEFKRDILGNKQAEKYLQAIDVTKTLQHLPKRKTGVAYDKGFIVVLAGAANLANILAYKVQFGIAVTSTGGFETRIFMAGGIGNAVTLAIDGGIHAQRSGATRIDGGCDLQVAGLSLIKPCGMMDVTGQHFRVVCKLTIAESIEASGELYIGRSGVYIEIKSGLWRYGSGQQKPLEISGKAEFDARGMSLLLSGKQIFSTNCSLEFYVHSTGSGVRIDFDISGLNEVFLKDIQAQFDTATNEVEKQIPGVEDFIEKTIENVESFDQLRLKLPGVLVQIKSKVQSAIRNQAATVYNGLNGTERAAVNAACGRVIFPPGKKDRQARANLQDKAVERADQYLRRLDTLKKQLQSIKESADETTRVVETKKAIASALDDAIALNGTKVPFKIGGIAVASFPIRFNAGQLIELRNLINNLPNDLSKLKSKKKLIAKTAAGLTANGLRDAVNSIRKGAKDRIPQIQSLALDTSLVGLSSPEVTVDVEIKQGTAPTFFAADVNLMNLAESISAITRSFAKKRAN